MIAVPQAASLLEKIFERYPEANEESAYRKPHGDRMFETLITGFDVSHETFKNISTRFNEAFLPTKLCEESFKVSMTLVENPIGKYLTILTPARTSARLGLAGEPIAKTLQVSHGPCLTSISRPWSVSEIPRYISKPCKLLIYKDLKKIISSRAAHARRSRAA